MVIPSKPSNNNMIHQSIIAVTMAMIDYIIEASLLPQVHLTSRAVILQLIRNTFSTKVALRGRTVLLSSSVLTTTTVLIPLLAILNYLKPN